MRFLKKLFGGADGAEDADRSAAPGAEDEYKGCHIAATPKSEGGHYRLCGLITKDFDGETREHQFIRADMFASADEAAEATLRKARQVIDERGDGLFG